VNATTAAPYAPTRTQAWVAVAVLFLVNVANYTDRLVLSVVLQPIKLEFGLSDTEMGLLTGAAFALCYALFGLWVARLADRYNRVTIISVSLLVWSAVTALTGFARSFLQLLVARVAVGIGESGAIATGTAIIADLFPLHRRAAPLAVFLAGSSVGITCGLMLGGWLAQQYGWRATFVIVGLPGIGLALLTALLLRDPPRGYSDGGVPAGTSTSLRQVLAAFVRNTTYVRLVLGASLVSFVLFGVMNWMPAFFIRRFGMTVAEVGTTFGLAIGLGGGLGMLAGGALTNRLVQRDARWLVWMPAVVILLSLPTYELAVFADSSRVAALLLFVANFTSGLAYGPVGTAVVSVVAPAMRATASATSSFVNSVIGIGLAPLLVGVVSDALGSARSDAISLQYSLAFCLPVLVLASALFWSTAADIRGRLAAPSDGTS
jgi:predicted MFS family arabinose efflux permease